MSATIAKSPRTARRITPAADASTRQARRRMIDPTTCDRDYGPDEVEFMQALDRSKRTHGRMFPTCSEILEVVRSLGYDRTGAVSA